MINQIAQEVLRQMKAMQGSASVGSASSVGGVLLSDMRPGAKVSEIKHLLEVARQRDCFGVCIPQWFISVAKETLVGTNVKIATIVGLPEGTNSPLAKYAEIKQAVVNGIDIVMVPVNMDYAKEGNTKAVAKDFAESITASRGKAKSAAIIEVCGMDNLKLVACADALVAAGADAIVLSCIAGSKVTADMVSAVKSKGYTVGVIGGAADAAGADWTVKRG